jgi:hypothetical protein
MSNPTFLRVPAVLISCLGAALSAQHPFECGMFVTEEGPGFAYAYHGNTGVPNGVLTVVPSANVMAIHTGNPTQHTLIGAAMGGVREVHRTTGALIKVINPTGGWQWAGLYAPSGEILVGDMGTNDVRRYHAQTGALLGVFGAVPGPADMVFGPNGNLFVCSFTVGGVFELHGTTGAFVAHHAQSVAIANDIVFLPDGRRIVTSMGDSLAHVFDSAWLPLATFGGTGWLRPHGIDRSPHDAHIYVVDGVTAAVHRFDPTTYAETHQAFVQLDSKPVDVEFRTPQQLCGVAVTFGPGCGGLEIDVLGGLQIGHALSLRVQGGRPGLPALLGVGDSNQQWNGLPLPFSLGGFGAPGCSLLTSQLVSLGAQFDSTGQAQLRLAVPRDPGLIGSNLFFQWVAVDPTNRLGLSLSNGADVRIGG